MPSSRSRIAPQSAIGPIAGVSTGSPPTAAMTAPGEGSLTVWKARSWIERTQLGMPISGKVRVGIFLVARSLLGRRRKQVLILKQPGIKRYARLHVRQGDGRTPPLLVHYRPLSQG